MIIEKQISLTLSRENENFQAAISLINGRLEELRDKEHLLHSEEKNLFHSLKHEARQQSYLLGRIAAKSALGVYAPSIIAHHIWIESGVFLFPVVKSSQLNSVQVSISHTNNLGLGLAFPESHPMGIDVEQIDNSKQKALATQMTKHEMNHLENISLDKTAVLTSLFCMKEALSKVLRTGMMLDFKLLEIKSIELVGSYMEGVFENFVQYKALSFLTKQHVVAIVLPKRTKVDVELLIEFFSDLEM